ncbi:beta-phosphoglucomutase-like phosphatase (HAD superfamily) [Rhizobium sp. BK316]|uniref:HAD hydrolase-like protein n=1 Tax=Rhizobium sp. BK316 TaxID=2587053 RepID=UPI0017C59D3F|nr:beta-phosphoglucomutase-like phosphatase (HAD superfamily) [Rhizobium sp. BK316]
MTIELLIFDCDGVLIDSEPVASGTLAQALQRAGVPLSSAEVHRRFTGLSGEAAAASAGKSSALPIRTRSLPMPVARSTRNFPVRCSRWPAWKSWCGM